jgi:type I restriction enzyme S subunit
MASDNGWKKLRIGNVCQKIGSGATPRGGKDSYQSDGISLIRSQNVYNEGFSRDGLAFINDEQADQLRNVVVEPHDVLLNITGESVCRVCQVPDDLLPARVNQHVVIIRPNPDILDARFLRYQLLGPMMQAHMNALSSAGATRRALTKGMIEGFEIDAPPVNQQQAIAGILGALDDKIELNRRMSETLEAMARAIFKSWFVDFDPVRAKLDGRQPPGMDADTAALFPDRFEHVDGEPIPKGWSKLTLGDFITLQRGKTYKSKLKNLPGPYLLGLGSIERNGGFRSNKLVTYGGDSPEPLICRPGDLYVSLKDVTQSADLLGAVARVPPEISQGRLTQDTVKLIFSDDAPSSIFVYRHLRTPQYRHYCKAHATGTTNLGLSRDDFFSYPISVPPSDLMFVFDRVVSVIDSRIESNRSENLTLTATRDALLPKLLSGKIRVADAEKIAEEVV